MHGRMWTVMARTKIQVSSHMDTGETIQKYLYFDWEGREIVLEGMDLCTWEKHLNVPSTSPISTDGVWI